MSFKNIIVFTGLVIVLAGSVFGFILFQNYQAEQKKIAELARIEALKKEAVSEYEEILNGFVHDVAKEIKAYKTQRTVLKELVRPHNYTTPENAKQNYEEYKNQILPSLRKQAEKVLNVFDLAGAKLDQVLESKPEETKLFLRTKWLAMRDTEYKNYKAFFDADNHVLSAYEELLRFYFVKAKSYKITEDDFVFEDKADKQAEQDLLKIIKDLQKQ